MLDEEKLKKFWSNVAIKTDDECWNWQAGKGSKGYGSFGIGNGKTASAHRIAYEITHGEIPDGLCVLHKCDNRACVNPNHLFLGTRGDNNRDMVNKGRHARGEKNGKAKLKNGEVIEIRWIASTIEDKKEAVKKLAKLFFVSESTIIKILREESWNFPLAE